MHPSPSFPTPEHWSPTDNKISKLDHILESSTVICSTLKNIGSASGVPYLSEVGTVALRILSIVQDIRSNREAFNDLVQDISGIVSAIIVECQHGTKPGDRIPERLQVHIQRFINNLYEIEQFAQTRLDRNSMSRIINHNKDKERISRYRVLLRQSLDIFGIQNAMSMQQMLERVAQSVEQQRYEIQEERLRREEQERRSELDRINHFSLLHIQEDSRQSSEEKTRKEESRRREEEERKKADQITRDAQLAVELEIEGQEERRRERARKALEHEERKSREERRRHLSRQREQELELERLETEKITRDAEVEAQEEHRRERARKAMEREEREIREEKRRHRSRQREQELERERLEELIGEREQHDRLRRSSPSPQPYQQPYLHPYAPVPPLSTSGPYLSPYMFSPNLGGSVSISNVTGSSISLGSSPVSINNWNSGNVVNTVINSPPSPRRRPRARDDHDL